MAQQNTVASESRSSSAASVICGRLRPVTSVAFPTQSANVLTPRVKASGVPSEKVGVDRIPGNQQLAESLKEGEVAVDLDRQVDVGQVGAGAEQSARLLRVPEVDQASLPKWVDRDQLRPVSFGDLEGTQHPRMIRARVLAGQDQQLGRVDIGEGDAGLPDSD
jgi:hypothetical protein